MSRLASQPGLRCRGGASTGEGQVVDSSRAEERLKGWGTQADRTLLWKLKGACTWKVPSRPMVTKKMGAHSQPWLHGVPADMKPSRAGPHLPGASLAGEAQQPQLQAGGLLPEKRAEAVLPGGGWGSGGCSRPPVRSTRCHGCAVTCDLPRLPALTLTTVRGVVASQKRQRT